MKRRLRTQPEHEAARWRSRRLLPAAAAGLVFIGAFGLGMATKSSSSPQTATSLASPVSIQPPQVTVPALERDVPTPALKPRPKPVSRHPTSPSTTPTATTPAVSSPGPTLPPASPQAPQTPPARVIHGQSGGGVPSSGGGGSVVHGGN